MERSILEHMLANHALQRTRPSRRGCNPTPSWAGSLSLGRSSDRCLDSTLKGPTYATLRSAQQAGGAADVDALPEQFSAVRPSQPAAICRTNS